MSFFSAVYPCWPIFFDSHVCSSFRWIVWDAEHIQCITKEHSAYLIVLQHLEYYIVYTLMSLPHWLLEIKMMTRRWLYLHMDTFYFPGNGEIWMHTGCNLSFLSSTFFLVRKHAVLPLQSMYLITGSIKPLKISYKISTGLSF